MSNLYQYLTLFFILFSCSQLSQVASQAKIEVCSDNYSDKNVDDCLIIVDNCVVMWMNSIKVNWQIGEKQNDETINPKTNKPVVKSDCNPKEPTSTGQAVGSNLTLSFTSGLKNASSIDLDFSITSNKADGYWIVDKASIKIDSKEFNLKATDFTAADTFSFSCSAAVVQSIKSSKDESKDFAIVEINRLQLQPFKSKNAKEHFTVSYDCATWFTIGTWMGLLVLLLFISFVSNKQIIQQQTIKYDIVPLSPLSKHRASLVKRKILVLDLDETLIHSVHDGVIRQKVSPGTPADFVLKVTIDRHPVRFFVHKRPHVDYFLEVVSHWYELVVFTASMEIYGAAVADKLDNNRNILKRRYFRQHCTLEYGSYTKDLTAISPDLSSIFILDNSPGAYRAFPNNAIPINSWFSDPRDTALLNLLPFLDALRFTRDVRSVLSRNLHLHNMW